MQPRIGAGKEATSQPIEKTGEEEERSRVAVAAATTPPSPSQPPPSRGATAHTPGTTAQLLPLRMLYQTSPRTSAATAPPPTSQESSASGGSTTSPAQASAGERRRSEVVLSEPVALGAEDTEESLVQRASQLELKESGEGVVAATAAAPPMTQGSGASAGGLFPPSPVETTPTKEGRRRHSEVNQQLGCG